ncbi:hypothetical protein A2U01_0109393 [Trifolium medium]|uniref:Uncharacterized protein n=1 Tax=Trifolium medium TaxID=97028 RepID=A0A392VJM1_9FABA|nr:hypothetical protein [Trifolium medium]
MAPGARKFEEKGKTARITAPGAGAVAPGAG